MREDWQEAAEAETEMTKIDPLAVAAAKTNVFESPKGAGQRLGDSAFLAYMAAPLCPLTQEVSSIYAAISESAEATQKPGSKAAERALPLEHRDLKASGSSEMVYLPVKPLETGQEIHPENYLENDSPLPVQQDGFTAEEAALSVLGVGSIAITEAVEIPKGDEPILSNPRRGLVANEPIPPILGQPTGENAFQLRTDSALTHIPLGAVRDGLAMQSRVAGNQGWPIFAPRGALATTDQPTHRLNRTNPQDLKQSSIARQRPDNARPTGHATHTLLTQPDTLTQPPVLVTDVERTSTFRVGTTLLAEGLAEGLDTTPLPQSTLIISKTDVGSDENGPLMANDAEQVSKLTPKRSLLADQPTQIVRDDVPNSAIQTTSDSVTKPLKAAIPPQVSTSVDFHLGPTEVALAMLQPAQYTKLNSLGALDFQQAVEDVHTMTTETLGPIANAVSIEADPSNFAWSAPLAATLGQIYPRRSAFSAAQPNIVFQGTELLKRDPIRAQALVVPPETRTVFRMMRQTESPLMSSAVNEPLVNVAPERFVESAFERGTSGSLSISVIKNEVIAPNSPPSLSYNAPDTSGLRFQDPSRMHEAAGKTIFVPSPPPIAPRHAMSDVQPVVASPIAPLASRGDFKAVVGQPTLEITTSQNRQTLTGTETTQTAFVAPRAKEFPSEEVHRPASNRESMFYGDAVGILPGKFRAPSLTAATAAQTTVFVPVPAPISAVPQHIRALISANKPSSIELTLTPEDLGKLRLVFTPEGDKLRIIIQAERPETLDLLRRNTESFSADLRQSGYASASFSFASWGDSPSSRSNPKQDNADEFVDSAEEAQAKPTPRATSIKPNGLDLRV